MDLILASTSPHRQALLTRLGVPFRVLAPGVDEDGPKALGLAPRDLAATLARAKAEAVARDHPDAVVIGSDQLVALDGQVLGKPGTAEAARAQLARLAGRPHQLITAMSVRHRGEAREHVEITTLTVRDLAPGEIGRYVAADRPLDCAGSYKVESLGIALFDRIAGEDHTAIVGLPLMALARILREFGLAIP